MTPTALPGQPMCGDEPVFREPWEAHAFAMTLALHQRGLFTWPEWAAALSAQIAKAQAAGDAPAIGRPAHAGRRLRRPRQPLRRPALEKNTVGYPITHDPVEWFVGSEGTFGITTKVTVRLTRNPQLVVTLLADFLDLYDASRAVSAIIAAGMLPAALEMIDIVTINAVEDSIYAAGYPRDAAACLIIELDGLKAGLDTQAKLATEICFQHNARTVREARDETERKKLWAGRKGAFGALGRVSPDLLVQDAVVPRVYVVPVLATGGFETTSGSLSVNGFGTIDKNHYWSVLCP